MSIYIVVYFSEPVSIKVSIYNYYRILYALLSNFHFALLKTSKLLWLQFLFTTIVVNATRSSQINIRTEFFPLSFVTASAKINSPVTHRKWHSCFCFWHYCP